MRFCTSDYAPHERLEAWREIYGRTLLKLDIEPIEAGAFHTDVRMRKVPGLGMITGSRSATFYRRNRIDNDDLVMSFGLGGGFEAMQFGRTETMQPGDAVMVTAGAPGHLRASSGGRTITLCLPRAAAAHAVTRSTPAVPAHSRRQFGLAAADALRRHSRRSRHAGDRPARHAVAHVHDLVALALGATRDGAERQGARRRAARLRSSSTTSARTSRTIFDRHRRGAPSPAGALRAAPVRDRRSDVHRYVLEARLAAVHRMLRDPRLADVKIACVLRGRIRPFLFFNRIFRRRYGVAPSDLRVPARPVH